MNREQVKEVFKLIVSIYPQFEVNTHKLDIWTSLMRDQNFERVMERTKRYAQINKFPPTIADITERTDETRNDFLIEIKRWEEESVGNPAHRKSSS